MSGKHPSQHIYRMIGKLSSRGVDVDDDHVQDRGGPGGDARRQPGVVVNVGVPFPGHAG